MGLASPGPAEALGKQQSVADHQCAGLGTAFDPSYSQYVSLDAPCVIL